MVHKRRSTTIICMSAPEKIYGNYHLYVSLFIRNFLLSQPDLDQGRYCRLHISSTLGESLWYIRYNTITTYMLVFENK